VKAVEVAVAVSAVVLLVGPEAGADELGLVVGQGPAEARTHE
jgi:hypothetical protein